MRFGRSGISRNSTVFDRFLGFWRVVLNRAGNFRSAKALRLLGPGGLSNG